MQGVGFEGGLGSRGKSSHSVKGVGEHSRIDREGITAVRERRQFICFLRFGIYSYKMTSSVGGIEQVWFKACLEVPEALSEQACWAGRSTIMVHRVYRV